MARGGTNGVLDVGADELAQGVTYVPTSQFVLNSAATGFLLDPSSPDSGLIGTTINLLPVWSAYQTAQHIARPDGTWADFEPALVVTYSFQVGRANIAAGIESFSSPESQAGARLAMQLYTEVSGVQFQESADVNVADINFGFRIGTTNGGGSAGYPNGTGGGLNVGHVSWEPTMVAGTYSLNLLLHELGHGVGLAHPGNYNGDTAVYADSDHYNDSDQYTNMSYWSETYTGASFSQLATLGLHDILATQMEYGINWSSRSSDTIYGYNATAGSNSYDFSFDNTMAFSIWDGGGTDMLDFSGFSGATVIDLRQGGFSSTGLETYNVSIAYGAVVENATGGIGNDRMMGNSTTNVLSGGAGSDVIFGGSETNAVASVDQRDFTGILLNEAPLVRNQYLSAGTNNSLVGSAFTIEMLVDLIRIPADGATLASYAVAGQLREFVIEAREAHTDYVYTNGIGAWVDYPSTLDVTIHGVTYRTSIPTESLVDGNPHRLSVAWDRASGRLDTYVDGALRDTAVHQQGVTLGSGGTLVFGQEQGSVGGGFIANQVLQGTIGDIRIFNDVRTAQEVTDNAFTRLTGSEQGLANNWQVQAGATTTVTDVAVANPPIDLTNLMPVGTFTASQSSTYPGSSAASNILDNNNGTWSHTNSGATEWLRLDFSTPLDLTYIEIVNRPGQTARINGATVSVLDAQGTVLYTSAPIANAGSIITILLPDLADASRIQIDRVRPAGSTENIINISEVNVFGQPPAGVVVPPALVNTDLTIVNGGTVHDTAPVVNLTPDNDTLIGGAGRDTLYGGAGNDMLYGHGGNTATDSQFAPTYAVELNAGATADQYAVVSNYSGISGASGAVQFSIEMLVNVSRLPSGGEIDFVTYANSQTANAIGIGGYSNGNIYLTYRNNEQDTGLSTSLLSTGGEHRLSLTFDGRVGGNYVLYIDGVAVYTHASPTTSMTAGGTLIFGQEQDTIGGGFQASQIFPGTIADIRVFNDIRTPAEIAANAFAPLANPLTEQGLVNNWQVTTGTTTTIADAHGGSALTLVGAAAPVVTTFGNWDNDTLDGGIGNDLLNGGAGADALIGGAGTDTATYVDATTGIIANLAVSASNTGEAIGDTYNSIENLTGSAFPDILTGDASANVINGGSGNDIINGGLGADTLIGGFGTDTATYASAAAAVNANLAAPAGNTGEAAGDNYNSIENLTGSAFADTLTGDANANVIDGGSGNDIINGGLGADALIGGFGTDTATYASAAAAVNANLAAPAGNTGEAAGDTYSSIENLTGSAFADTLTGDANANLLDGGAGDDTLTGGAGADMLVGGAGTDTATYVNAAAAVIASLASPGSNTGEAAGDTYISIENLTGSAFADILVGDASANMLDGGAGDDILIGGAGADTLIGGAGLDTLSFVGSVGGVTVDLSTQTGTGGDAEGDVYSGIENVIGGSGNDTITGDSGANILDGGAGTDTISYATSTAGVSVNLATNIVSGGNAVGDIIFSFENVTGGSGNDALTGDDGANLFIGGAGDDTITGNGGNDFFYSGSGNDTVFGGVGIDILLGDAGTDTLYGGADFDYLFGGDSNDLLYGGAFVDVLYGDAGSDTIYGGDDTDHLFGGVGIDTLYGDLGNDIFYGSAEADIMYGGDGQDYFYGNTGGEMIYGGLGVDVILSADGDDTIDAGLGVDYAWGGNGNDLYLLNATSNGILVINDFAAGGSDDVVRVSGAPTIATFAQAQAAMTYVAGINTTILTIDGDTSIWFIGIAASQLTAADFMFV
jgi:Ca2+-binding RTX toxin-like protein